MYIQGNCGEQCRNFSVFSRFPNFFLAAIFIFSSQISSHLSLPFHNIVQKMSGFVAQAVRPSPPAAGARVRISIISCGFPGGGTEIRVGFSLDCSRFAQQQFSFHHLSTLVSFSPASGVLGRSTCYSKIFNQGALSLLILRPGPVSDTS